MSNLENSKVSDSLKGILILRYFLAFLSDLNFVVNIQSRKLFRKNLRDLKHIAEQIRTTIKSSIDFSNFQQFNHSVSGKTFTPIFMIKENRTFERFLNSLSLNISTRNYA